MRLRVLVFGAGWLGGEWADRAKGSVLSPADIADAEAVNRALDEVRPDRVVNCAGETGHPNVDALEGRPAATYRSNVVGPLVLASACRRRNVHLTHMGSGCVYSGDNGGAGWGEDDPPNFRGSLYARSKAVSEAALRDFPGVLQLRIRMPIGPVPHPRNLLTKLLGYERIVSVPNSVTVLDDFWPVALALQEREATGVWNVVNDGVERHDEFLALYRDRVDPALDIVTTDVESLGLVAGRSNCVLSTAKLHEAGLALPHLDESLPRAVDRYAETAR